MYKALKRKIGYYHIWKNRRNQHRKKQVFNLKTANSIGILFDATRSEDFDTVREFHHDLKKTGHTVSVLGFVNDKEIPAHYLFKKDFILCSKKMLNWYDRPIVQEVIDFSKCPFDILIDLTMKDHFVFDYITGSSPARFKVGRYREKPAYVDMMIQLEEETSLEYFIELVTSYLETINRPELSPNF
ncbi:MAG: hypothetical protein GWP10_19505, partial [Nitrospiraceae bacterium]|nr:hypothetical protein [Nitrospiraceae bacterium]